MNWKTVHSDSRPAETDTTSSKVYNYVRRNIREETITEDGTTRTGYVYEEAKIRKDDWATFTELAQQRADIDYLLMITEEE